MDRRLVARDDGFTLVELMVVVVVGGIVLGVAVNALIQSQRTVAGTLQRQSDLGEARIAADAASADLRTLVPLNGTHLLTATATEVTFFALRDVPEGEGPVRIRIVQEADGDLVRYSTRPPPGLSTASPDPSVYDGPLARTGTPRLLASGLRSNLPVFRYYASYGLVPIVGASPSASPSASEIALLPPGGGATPSVPAASRRTIRFVEIQLEVQQPGARDVGVTPIRQIVRLPNM